MPLPKPPEALLDLEPDDLGLLPSRFARKSCKNCLGRGRVNRLADDRSGWVAVACGCTTRKYWASREPVEKRIAEALKDVPAGEYHKKRKELVESWKK